jgi:hypothetical protein
MTWGFARNTAANAVELRPSGEREKFLFYRGLGRLDLPLVVRAESGGLSLENRDTARPLGGLLAMVVTREAAGFALLGDLAPGATLRAEVPQAALSLASFVEALKRTLADRLVADGLYTDEAQAMVDTWERAYFLTPGVRVLYLLPQATTDRILPLAIKPAPAVLRRTVVVRVEALQPDLESALAEAVRRVMSEAPAEAEAGRAAFLGHGRFAEPYLTRALALVPGAAEHPGTGRLLAEVRARLRWAPSWAE